MFATKTNKCIRCLDEDYDDVCKETRAQTPNTTLRIIAFRCCSRRVRVMLSSQLSVFSDVLPAAKNIIKIKGSV